MVDPIQESLAPDLDEKPLNCGVCHFKVHVIRMGRDCHCACVNEVCGCRGPNGRTEEVAIKLHNRLVEPPNSKNLRFVAFSLLRGQNPLRGVDGTARFVAWMRDQMVLFERDESVADYDDFDLWLWDRVVAAREAAS